MNNFPKRQGCRNGIKGAVFALLASGFGWLGTAVDAHAIDLSYAAYRMEGAKSAEIRSGDMISSGENLLIEIKYLNASSAPTPPGSVVFTLPQGCAFVKAERAGSVEVSVDGGLTFGRFDRLTVRDGDRIRRAAGTDVTHVKLVLERPILAGEGVEIRIVAVRD